MSSEIAAWLRTQAEADLKAAKIISDGGFAPQWWDTDPPGQVNPPGHPASAAVTAAIGRDEESSCGWVPLWVRDQVIGQPPDDYASGVAVLAEVGRREFDHVRRHDPRTEAARAESVLAVVTEYEAARVVLEAARTRPDGVGAGMLACVESLGRVMRLLAWGYRNQPGYLVAWRP